MSRHSYNRSVVAVALGVLAAALASGCEAPAPVPDRAKTDGPDLEATLARARSDGRPLLILVSESDPRGVRARAALDDAAVRDHAADVMVLRLDLEISRVRAQATRFHLGDAPLLLALSSHGVIVHRAEGDPTPATIAACLDTLPLAAADADAELATLETVAATSSDDANARMQWADFFIRHHNAREAIPHLTAVRQSSSAPLPLRIRAYVEESKAHFWVMESEKGRHVPQELIDTLGKDSPDAKAAGYYALGSYEIKGRHKTLGMTELEQAIAAAPDSPYGKLAAEVRAQYLASQK